MHCANKAMHLTLKRLLIAAAVFVCMSFMLPVQSAYAFTTDWVGVCNANDGPTGGRCWACSGTPDACNAARPFCANHGGGPTQGDASSFPDAEWCPSGSTPPVVAGVCGSANSGTYSSAPHSTNALCSSGTASPVSGSGPWAWTCAGSGGGNSASCSASTCAVPVSPQCSAPVAATCSGTVLGSFHYTNGQATAIVQTASVYLQGNQIVVSPSVTSYCVKTRDDTTDLSGGVKQTGNVVYKSGGTADPAGNDSLYNCSPPPVGCTVGAEEEINDYDGPPGGLDSNGACNGRNYMAPSAGGTGTLGDYLGDCSGVDTSNYSSIGKCLSRIKTTNIGCRVYARNCAPAQSAGTCQIWKQSQKTYSMFTGAATPLHVNSYNDPSQSTVFNAGDSTFVPKNIGTFSGWDFPAGLPGVQFGACATGQDQVLGSYLCLQPAQSAPVDYGDPNADPNMPVEFNASYTNSSGQPGILVSCSPPQCGVATVDNSGNLLSGTLCTSGHASVVTSTGVYQCKTNWQAAMSSTGTTCQATVRRTLGSCSASQCKDSDLGLLESSACSCDDSGTTVTQIGNNCHSFRCVNGSWTDLGAAAQCKLAASCY